MTWSTAQHDEFRGLLGRLAERPMSSAELQRFNELMAADAQAPQMFVDYAMLDVCLEMSKGTDEDRLAARRVHAALGHADDGGDGEDSPVFADTLTGTAPESPIPQNTIPTSPPSLGFLGAAAHGTVNYFSQIGPLSYLIATIIMLLGSAVAWQWKVADNAQIAHQSGLRDATRLPHGQPAIEFVGKVTAMVDCCWADANTATFRGAYVPLGRKYALSSGLMEITYDTGAQVILQGPVTYEVDEAAGGFLSVGKLTARVEKKAEGGGRRADNVESLSSTLRLPTSALFSVRTPTATVTDLGTEFGVEVQESGVTSAHVFRGVVEVHVAADRGKPGIRLIENESVRVDPSGGVETATVQRGTADATAFVQPGQLTQLTSDWRLEDFRRWQTHSQKLRSDPSLVAYYDFQRREDSPNVLPSVGTGSDAALDGQIKGAKWTAGRMPGKQALYFDGYGACVKVNLPQRMTQMTLAASVAIELITDGDDSGSGSLLMADGWTNGEDFADKCHWQIVRDGTLCLSTVARGRQITSPVIPWQQWRRQRWRHVAVVADPANRQVTHYLDGEAVFRQGLPEQFAARFGSAQIGAWWSMDDKNERPFCGRIDELLILSRVMTDEEIKEMYTAGTKP